MSYDSRGGGKAAAQLRQVVEGGLHMDTTATSPALLTGAALRDAASELLDPAVALAPHAGGLEAAAAELGVLLAERAAAAKAQ